MRTEVKEASDAVLRFILEDEKTYEQFLQFCDLSPEDQKRVIECDWQEVYEKTKIENANLYRHLIKSYPDLEIELKVEIPLCLNHFEINELLYERYLSKLETR